MRNLSLSSVVRGHLPNANICATVIDVETSFLYVADDRSSDQGVKILVWKAEAAGAKLEVSSEPVATFDGPSSLTLASTSQVAAFHILSETHALALITRSGDIAVLSLDDDAPANFEVEGGVDDGILAASWNSDSSLLVLVTGNQKLILMTSTFDVLSESLLHRTDFGEDAPMNLGWGSKQTQFHGTIGKESALATAHPTVGSSPDDDALPRVSWRGDGAFFAVSSLSPSHLDANVNYRVIRVYSRTGVLQSTSEATPGLEHPLAWRPSGSLIASTQRFGGFPGSGIGKEGRHDIIFFERNGLRRGEFALGRKGLGSGVQPVGKGGHRVREISWSLGSDVLAVWLEENEGDVVQLWTCGNFHWYLKQEIPAPKGSFARSGRFTAVTWHPENNLHLTLTTAIGVQQRLYSWDTFVSHRKPPEDSGCVCVIDSSCLLLTAFRMQNIPPPMSSYTLSLSPSPLHAPNRPCHTPVHASLPPSADLLSVLWESGYFEIWRLDTRLDPHIRGPPMNPNFLWAASIDLDVTCRQILVLSDGRVAVLGQTGSECDVVYVFVASGEIVSRISLPGPNGRLTEAGQTQLWQARDGELFHVNLNDDSVAHLAKLPDFCSASLGDLIRVPLADSSVGTLAFVGLSDSGNLYGTCPGLSTAVQKLASNATAFTIASDLVISTTNDHETIFIPLLTLATPQSECAERRKVERGSRIVTAVPSTMSLVLQMPRGNLETINPRPLVLRIVSRDLDMGNYRKAFLACRKHRIDLTFLVSHDQMAFLEKIPTFVQQIDSVDYLNLFLSNIRGTLPFATINAVCDGIRVELEKKDMKQYINSILTAHVVKCPPDHESGLAVLLRFREAEPDLVEEAVKYIIFLVDADRLFDAALGMYDISLVLMIAQHARRDPREYISFLRELTALGKYYQRFRIDDHLRQYDKALRNLSLAGCEHFAEAMDYLEKHRLYDVALGIWKGTEHYSEVLVSYGDWLFEQREFSRAALMFREAGKPLKAMKAHEKALEWQELFALALHSDVEVSQEQVISMAYGMADQMRSKKMYLEAARILLDYCNDTRNAVGVLVQGNHFSEAQRIMSLKSSPDLLVDVLHPAALETCVQIADDIDEMQEQFRKQLSRLRELRVKKVEEHDFFYNIEDADTHNIETMTDASTPATAFTRYTVPSTTMTRQSKRSSRSKRKLELKIASGRKGTVNEEVYLLNSLHKLVERFKTSQGDFVNIGRHLLRFTPEHRAEGAKLQKELRRFEAELRDGVDGIWGTGGAPAEGTEGWRERMHKAATAPWIDPVEIVAKPEIMTIKSWISEFF